MNKADDMHPERIESVAERCRALHRDHIEALAERLLFERRNSADSPSGNPMVLVIGNHSSGKSTLMNHLLESTLQDTGVAPTDDGFTVIRHGDTAEVRDGSSLVGHPEMGFAGLQQFGPTLVSHLRLKRFPASILRRITLVDTPGMIDSAHAEVGRGYDFLAVVRWFAERADVIVLLFDPDKPGTTGETLTVLKSALVDLSHKVLFVLNKVDRFESVNDFAKAYGALCWNLAKAIPKKDVPAIFSMYVPGPWVSENPHSLPLESFDAARSRVFTEIGAAPQKRVDNLVTNLYEQSRQLALYATIGNEARRRYRRVRLGWRASMVAAPAAALGLSAAAYALGGGANWPWIVAGVVVAILSWLLLRWAANKSLVACNQRLREGLGGIFARLFERELRIGTDTDLRALWQRVEPKLATALEITGLERFPRARKTEIERLNRIVDTEAPTLRRQLHTPSADHSIEA
jgi:GTPase SAR1 family protein